MHTDQDLSSHPHVLVIDDDARIRALICRYLHQNGWVAMESADPVAARALMALFDFDVLVVDVMMPKENGLDFTRSLRTQSDIPVLLLTALGEAGNRVTGLETGADDYLVKPFEPRELVLRLESLLRRRPAPKNPATGTRIGHWWYDPQMRSLTDSRQGLRYPLTDMESALLSALVARKGEIVTRDDLAALCAPDAGARTIDVQVARLRRKLEPDSRAPLYLHTVRGKGYVLRAQDVEEAG